VNGPAGEVSAAAVIKTLPPKAAKMLAVEILLADPGSLGDDVLESTSARARSRCRPAGPSSAGRPSFYVVEHARRPWGITDTGTRSSIQPSPAPGLDLGPGLAGGPTSRAVQVSRYERGLAPLTAGGHGAPRVERGDGLRPRWRRNAAPPGRVLLPAVGDQQVHPRLPCHPRDTGRGGARPHRDRATIITCMETVGAIMTARAELRD